MSAPFGSDDILEQDFLFPDTPAVFTEEAVIRLLSWGYQNNVSDITLQTDEPVWMERYGRLLPVTLRPLSHSEMQVIATQLYRGEHAAGVLAGGQDIDCSYEIKVSRTERQRFRVNITAGEAEGGTGFQATLRALPSLPPVLAEMGIEQAIIDARQPRQGLVLITGPTGSGKSTLLAAIIRDQIEDPNSHRKILTYEAPVEFVYHGLRKQLADGSVRWGSSVIHQVEIGRHLKSFAAGLRNSLRRKPMVILVGEARDAETIGAACNASVTGHLVYSTVHSNGVPATIRRMVNEFDPAERRARSIDLMESLQMIVTQSLLPTVDGKRAAAREFLVFDEHTRLEFLRQDPDHWPLLARRLLKDRGQPMEVAVGRLFEQGKITEDQHFRYILKASAEADMEAAA